MSSVHGPVTARTRRGRRELLIHAVILLVTLALLEGILRVADFRELRDGYGQGYPLVFRHDPQLGWAPIANSAGPFHGSRTVLVQHNSLGLRDAEVGPPSRPTVLFVGDSFAWGYDVEAKERFSDLLRPQLPGVRIVNAGVPGYGTDQEYLLLKRIWDKIEPDIVVLIFCTGNDHQDNSTNVRSDGYYKPYLVRSGDGTWQFAGQPVPRSRQAYFLDNPLVRNLWLARLAITAYVPLAHPAVSVPDPTEQLVTMMRDFVEARSATFLVGLQTSGENEVMLKAHHIRYTAFDGAESYPADGNHWTPKGHVLVADRLLPLLREALKGSS